MSLFASVPTLEIPSDDEELGLSAVEPESEFFHVLFAFGLLTAILFLTKRKA